MRLEVFKGRDGWFVRAVAANGKTLTISESYVTKSNALRAARRVRFAIAFSKIAVV